MLPFKAVRVPLPPFLLPSDYKLTAKESGRQKWSRARVKILLTVPRVT